MIPHPKRFFLLTVPLNKLWGGTSLRDSHWLFHKSIITYSEKKVLIKWKFIAKLIVLGLPRWCQGTLNLSSTFSSPNSVWIYIQFMQCIWWVEFELKFWTCTQWLSARKTSYSYPGRKYTLLRLRLLTNLFPRFTMLHRTVNLRTIFTGLLLQHKNSIFPLLLLYWSLL